MINTAAYHDVEKMRKRAGTGVWKWNGLGARNLAMVCNEIDAALMHISTDYVFDGKNAPLMLKRIRPCRLMFTPIPNSAANIMSKPFAKKFYIVRVSGIYGKTPAKAKAAKTLSKQCCGSPKTVTVRVVDDEILTPTSTVEIARQIVKMADSSPEYGIYHVTAEGSCSWYEFAKEIFDITKTGY